MLVEQESIHIEDNGHQLHLRHIWQQTGGTPILMIHGAIENGRIFYTEKGKGLACYLARQGFDVYVADLRGRGNSKPSIDKGADYGQTEAITQDLPAFVRYVSAQTGQKMHLVAHSWGGVLLASCLARFAELRPKILSKVCFGTKRSVSVRNVERLFKVDLIWNRLAIRLARKHGYLDAKKWRFGADSETQDSLEQSVAWVKLGQWVDPKDGFDYADAAAQVEWPPLWHIAAIKDKVLGHPTDVKRFADETGHQDYRFSLLSKKRGNMVDYDHINMLTHPSAESDHFPQVSEWLKQHS